MRTHTRPTPDWVGQVERGEQYLYEYTHLTNTRLGWGKLKEVNNSSMRTHTRPTPDWVEAS